MLTPYGEALDAVLRGRVAVSPAVQRGLFDPRSGRVVIMACTKAKLSYPAAASRLYTGIIWREWRRHGPSDGALPNGWALYALSARHGLVRSWETIEPYDHRLDAGRVAALAPAVSARWTQEVQRWEWAAPECIVIGGEHYQDLATAAGLPVVGRIDGRPGGIGLLRLRVRAFALDVRHGLNIYPGDASEAWDRACEGCRQEARP